MNMSIRLRIKSIYNDLSPKEQQIAEYILKNPDKVIYSSINELSSELEVADSTLFNFTKKIGYSGFKQFKMAMAVQQDDMIDLAVHERVSKDDNELTVAHKVFDTNISTLQDTQKFLKQDDLKDAAEMIATSNRTYFFGLGGSQIVAADAYHKFLRTPVHVSHSGDYHIQLMEASLLSKDDCAIIISHTGRSKEAIKITEVIKEAGAKAIIITSQANSPLAKLGDIVFMSVAEETEFRSEALSSRISQLSIIDSLYVIVMFHFDRTSEESLLKVRHVIADIKL